MSAPNFVKILRKGRLPTVVSGATYILPSKDTGFLSLTTGCRSKVVLSVDRGVRKGPQSGRRAGGSDLGAGAAEQWREAARWKEKESKSRKKRRAPKQEPRGKEDDARQAQAVFQQAYAMHEAALMDEEHLRREDFEVQLSSPLRPLFLTLFPHITATHRAGGGTQRNDGNASL